MNTKSTILIVFVAVIIVQFLPTFLKTKSPLLFGGSVSNSKWNKVEEDFKENFYWGWEHEGAAFAVYHKGEKVVDLWGGYADDDAMIPWKENTMTVVYSSTKAVASLCVAILVDRGNLDYDQLVTKYWPEFGKNGKSNVTVAMLMNHQAGLVIFDKEIEKEDVWDHKRMSKLIENQKPNWPAGRASGYHGLTFGFLIDQLIRRTDTNKRSIGQFFNEEIAKPYDVEFYIGLPLSLSYKVARASKEGTIAALSTLIQDVRLLYLLWGITMHRSNNSFLQQMGENIPFLGAPLGKDGINDPEIYAMEIAAANGIGTARGLAKIFSLALEGKIISKKTLEKVLEPIINEKDVVIGFPIARALGFMLIKRPKDYSQEGWLVGHPGYGGQNVIFDVENDLIMAYVTNGIKTTFGELTRTWTKLKKAVYESL